MATNAPIKPDLTVVDGDRSALTKRIIRLVWEGSVEELEQAVDRLTHRAQLKPVRGDEAGEE